MRGLSHIALLLALDKEPAIDLRSIPAETRCPSQAMLGDALEARIPGVAQRSGAPERAGLLRLELADAGAAGVRFALVDERGRVVLERTLAPADGGGADRAGACAVRAETIALVVERYLRQLGYREPGRFPAPVPPVARAEAPPAAPPPPPLPAAEVVDTAGHAPPRLTLAAGIGVRPGARWPTRMEPELLAELTVARMIATLSVALTLPVDVAIADGTSAPGTLRYEALPLRVGIGVPLPLPRRAGWVAPTVLAGIDLFSAETRGIGVPATVRGVQPAADIGLVAMIALGSDRLALRPQALVGLRRERGFRLVDAGPGEPPIFVDPWFSLRFGVDLAYSFGKK